MIEKEDLRVKKTKIALTQAMFTLLERQSFKKVTVNDICREALVSRSAFYVHFEDKYRLLQSCLEEVKEQTARECEELSVKERILTLLQTIQRHSGIFRNLVVEDLDSEVSEMLRQSFLADFQETGYQATGPNNPASSIATGTPQPDVPLELSSVYYGAGITSVVTLWIIKELPYTAEEVAQYLYQLLQHLIEQKV